MQWLLHPSVSEETGRALTARGDTVHRADAFASVDVLESARKNQWDLITADAAPVREVLAGKEKFTRSIVLIQGEQDSAIDRLFTRYKRLVPARLYTITGSRVKVRQLPKSFSRKSA